MHVHVVIPCCLGKQLEFSLCDYDMDNPIVRKCLSHCVALCMDQVTNLSRLFSAEKNMLAPGYSGHLCKGDITVPKYICIRCRNALMGKQPVMPDQACANSLELYPIPNELANMFPIECRVVSFRIPFIMVIVVRRYSGHYKINGPPVNVPATLDHIVQILPCMPNQLQLHPLKLKRQLEYRSHYMYNMICKDKVISAILWLKENNKHYSGVVIDTCWLDELRSNDVPLFRAEDDTDIDRQVDSDACVDGPVDSGVGAIVGVNGGDVAQTGKEKGMQKCRGRSSDTNVPCSTECGPVYSNKNTEHKQDCGPLCSDNDEEVLEDQAELLEDQAAIDQRQDMTGDPITFCCPI